MVCCHREPAGWMSYLEGSSISTCVATNHNHYCQVYMFLFSCFGLFWLIFATVGRFAWGRVSLFSRIYLSPDRGEWLRKCANNLISRILNPVKVCVLFKYFPWTVTQAVCAALTLIFASMIIFLVFQTPELRPCDQSSVGVTSMTSHHQADWGLILTRVQACMQIHHLWSRNR